MTEWLPRLVARIPATVHAKLLVAFLAITLLLIVLGAVGLEVLSGVNRRAEHPRQAVGQFSARQVSLLQTFADQAVIAIENVRLFTQLQEKNRALTEAHAQVTEALDQQTSTAEILRVISNSPTDLQPVFDTIVESVVKLCGGVSAFVYRFDGNLIHLGEGRVRAPIPCAAEQGEHDRPGNPRPDDRSCA